VVNTSPEPFSNVAVSSLEDVTSAGLLYMIYAYPLSAGIVAVVLALLAAALIFAAWRIIGRLFRRA